MSKKCRSRSLYAASALRTGEAGSAAMDCPAVGADVVNTVERVAGSICNTSLGDYLSNRAALRLST